MKVLDTDILIGLLRKNPDAINKMHEIENENVVITVFTWQELLFGPAVTGNKEELKVAVELLDSYNHLNYEKDDAFYTARILSHLKKTGNPIGVIDGMIAGICLRNNASIVTRNSQHFSKVAGLKVESW